MTISWLIYLASLANSLGNLLLAMGIVLAIAAAVSLIGMWAMAVVFTTPRNNRDGGPDGDAIAASVWLARWTLVFKRTWAWCLICFILVVVIPSSNTIYAIAAAQVGDQVMNSKVVQGIADDATKALQQWIKRQIDPPKSDK